MEPPVAPTIGSSHVDCVVKAVAPTGMTGHGDLASEGSNHTFASVCGEGGSANQGGATTQARPKAVPTGWGKCLHYFVRARMVKLGAEVNKNHM